MKPDDSARISPTAHYTSYVWFRNGLSHPALVSPAGRALHLLLRPLNVAYERFGQRPSLDMMLLARHHLIDYLLQTAIEEGRISQVLEVAAGFSPRGLRFAARYAHRGLVYVEGDLPAQAARKKAALEGAALRGSNHHIVPLDALADEGPGSLADVAARHFDPRRGLAIITEGLLGYFDRPSVEGMWGRFARCLQGFRHGAYYSDLNLAADVGAMRTAVVFKGLLGVFARGRVHLHYDVPDAASSALRGAGFREARIHAPRDFAAQLHYPGKERHHLVRVLDAEV